MAALIRDRYLPCGFDTVRDLATGEVVGLDASSTDERTEPELATLVEVLEHGQEGVPRWIVMELPAHDSIAAGMRRAAADAQSRGFVPVSVEVYLQWHDAIAEHLRERSLCLLGGEAVEESHAKTALLRAAAACPRPHVLLTFRAGPRHGASIAREAKAVYGAGPRQARLPPIDPDVERHRQRAARAVEFVRAGRHAAAERLLRDVAGALARRNRLSDAARTLIELGRLLLERGRVSDADRTFEDAATLGTRAEDALVLFDARIWQAAARTDGGRLTEAEAICRALLAAGSIDAGRRSLVHATLARVALWQRRPSDAAGVDLSLPAAHGLESGSACFVAATAVRVHLAEERIFDAGLRARQLIDETSGGDALVRTIALTAHLRVMAAAGDLQLAEAARDAVVGLATELRTPLRAVRARLIVAGALLEAGRVAAGRQEVRRVERICDAASPLLRRTVRELLSRPVTQAAGSSARPLRKADAAAAVRLVTLAHEHDDDAMAVRRVLESVADASRTSRIDVMSADAGPATSILHVGSGLATHLGERVLEAGIVLGPERAAAGIELAVPMPRGRAINAAIVARWPADRAPTEGARELLEIAAAVVRPRVEALQSTARASARAATAVPELVGASAAIGELRVAIARAAASPFAVLVLGESGVGKELVARAIHDLSARRERKFCDVNCAALPDDLLESELFGHARGAFTGAVADRAGLFEDATGGTVFLDEIADLSPRGQAKLLRVLQQQEVRRVGETFTRAVDVRVVAAANRDLRQEAERGRFRQDLLYRLDVIRIRIPPLRERPDDIPLLARHFWEAYASRMRTTAGLSHAVLAALARYHWPGNVRELQNVVAALAVAAPARGVVRPHLLPAAIAGVTSVAATRLADARAQLERRMIESALARAGGSRTRAARELGLSRQGLLKMMARLHDRAGDAEPGTGN